MDVFSQIYLSAWGFACLFSLVLFLKDKNSYALSHARYWRFLLMPWKIVTFVIATTGLTVIAPYTGDPTWDYFDALFMALLTFLTAPWAIGAIYKVAKKELSLKQAYIAACLWMFSASWSYDLYLLIRDGYYPVTWFSNLFASSVLYLSAGLLWNLDWKEKKGVVFSFMEDDWPVPSSHHSFSRIIWSALPFMILVTCVILYLLWF
jgi:hypothetical protein